MGFTPKLCLDRLNAPVHVYTEVVLVEATAKQTFAGPGWQESFGSFGSLGRKHKGEAILPRREPSRSG